MKVFKKIILIFLLSSFLILLFSGFSFAQRKLETIYPTVPGVETPTTVKTALPEYLKYVFTFAIMVAGLLAFGALIYGGFSYLTSAGDPSKMKDGQDQIIAGILGLIIVLSSFLILNTINPQLVLPGGVIQPGKAGIKIYANSNDCGETPTAGKEPQDINEFLVSQSYPALYVIKDSTVILDWGGEGSYKISSIKFLSNPGDLTIEFYSGNDYAPLIKKYDESNYKEGDCQPYVESQPKSVKLDYHLPGVYLYATDNCTGNKYGEDYVTYQASSATLQDFDNKTKSIKFVYGDKDSESGEYRVRYAAILHEKENFMGEAALFDQEQGDANCLKLSDVGGLTLNTPSHKSKYFGSNLISICEAATSAALHVKLDEEGPELWEFHSCGLVHEHFDASESGYSGCPIFLQNENGLGGDDRLIMWVHKGETIHKGGLNLIDGISYDICPDQTSPGCKVAWGYRGNIGGAWQVAQESFGTGFNSNGDKCDDCTLSVSHTEYRPRNDLYCNDDGLWEETPPSGEGEGEGQGYGADLTNKVSSITVYVKPIIKDGKLQIIGQGARFWGDKNYTKEKDEYVLPSETGYYGDGDYDENLDDANDKISSMEMDGNYIALLCRDPNLRDECEVFTSSCADFRNHRIGQCGPWGRKDCLSSFIIKARK